MPVYKEKGIYNMYIKVDQKDNGAAAGGTTTHDLCVGEASGPAEPGSGFPRPGRRL